MKNRQIEKSDIVVVIPTYKEELSDFEKISLEQICRVLNEYNIIFACPETLEINYGEAYANCKIERFADKYFADISGYNMLMLSEIFYERFTEYTYILIAQLDAFIFEDSLLYFVNLGYDYIGAPWIHGIRYYRDVYNIIHYVGNGGLSIRKVTSFINWLTNEKAAINDYIGKINEDVLIAAYGKDFLKIIPFQEALQFAFDFDPKKSYQLNANRLPFGIHAWQKYDIDFCRSHIEKFGYKVPQVDNSLIKEDYVYRYSYEEKRNLYLKGLVNNGKMIIKEFVGENSCELYLWGTGLWGQLIGRIFNDLQIQYAGFIDNNKKEECILGHTILPSVDWEEDRRSNSKVLISVFNASDIMKQLNEIGLMHKRDYIVLDDFINETERHE